MKHKLLSILLCLAMALSLLPTAALADETTGAGPIKVGGTSYNSFSEAVDVAKPDESGVITYKISGKVDVTDIGWVQVAKAGLTDLSKVEFIGITDDAEICITQGVAILADQSYDIDVSFEALKLTKLNPQWAGDFGHSTNYFTCWLRNTNEAENTVTYTNCVFPNGVCDNQYGKTVFNNCRFTNSANYNLWNYGGNTEVKNSTFTGVRGIKTYNEGTLAVAPTVKIEQTTFSGLTEKAAIVASKPTNITLTTVTATDCTKGLLQKDIEGSTDEQKVTIEANGTDISADFNITGKKDAEAAKNEFNISGGEFTSEVKQDYCKDTFEVKAGPDGKYTVEQSNDVAKVGGTGYTTLEAALAALNETNHTLTLIDSSKWPAATPVYWKTNGEWAAVATLTDALKAAYMANAGDITIVCRPGADVGTMTHGHVADNLIIYGNDAFISGGECDLEVDTYMYSRETGKQVTENGVYLDKDITITAYELDNLGVWGQRTTNHTVTVNLTDCDGTDANLNQRIYISGNNGVNNITLKGCDFDSSSVCAVYSNADGKIVVDGCTFKNVAEPININHKSDGEQTVEVKNSTFDDCGSTDTADAKYAAPIRFVNSGSGTSNTTVDNCTFNNTVGNNGDILIGDGRDGKESKDVSLTVKNTAADVQAQKPGYYAANGAVAEAGNVSKTTIPASETPTTIKLESNKDFKLAEVNGVQMSSLTDALDYARTSGEPIKLLSADTALVQAILDGQYGSIDGLTIELPSGTYGALELGRATKYAGSNTVWYNGQWSAESGWTRVTPAVSAVSDLNNSIHFYERAISDVTLKAADGATVNVAGVKMTSGHMYGSSGAPNYDYVLDRDVLSTNDSYYLAQTVSNITFDGLTFTAKSDINTSIPESTINGFTFKNCTFNINNTADGNQAIRYYNENNNGKVSNLVVDNCKFNNCYQGVYTHHVKNVIVTNSEFDTTGHNAIAIQSSEDACDHGKVIITGNTFKNIGDRIIRFNNVGAGTQITITHNTATNSGDDKGEVIKATNIAEGVTTTVRENSWGAGTTVANNQFKDTAAPSYSGGSSSYDPTYSVSTPSKTKNGTVTVSPKSASKGDTVTVTVKPDSGYVLETLTVTDKNGNELTLKDKGNGKYTFTMPAGKVEVKATFMEDNSMLNFFYDVPNGAYFYEAVKWAVENGITTGVGNDLFAPEQPCTRAQIVTFLWRAAGSPEPKAASSFADVAAGSYYAKAVAWAVENGITTGTGDGKFSPDATCTRAQAVTFLARALNAKASGKAEFSDVPADSYFADAVAWAAANGVTEGIGGGLFGPDNDCTRGQIVTFLYRAYNK